MEPPKIKTNQPAIKKAFHVVVDFCNRFFIFTILGLIIIILVLGYWLLLDTQYARWYQSRFIVLPQINNQIANLEVSKPYFVEYLNHHEELSTQDGRLLNLALPDELDLASTMIQLNNMARNNGLAISKIDVKESATKSNDNQKLKEVGFNIVLVGGGYENLLNFLRASEKSLLFFNVTGVKFAKRNDGQMGYSLDLVTYYYQP